MKRLHCLAVALAFIGMVEIQSVLLASPRLDCSVSWIGNSFPGARKWVQQDIHAMFVTPDGTVYANVEWDEAGRNVGIYKDGDVIGNAGHTHGWGNMGGRAVGANSQYLFIAMSVGNEGGNLKDPNTWPPKGSNWFGLSRRLRITPEKPAPFPGGKGGKGDTLKESFLVINEVPEKTNAQLTGLWVDEQRVYVSNPWKNQIEVIDPQNMQWVARWPLENPGPMCMDAKGKLWVLIENGEGQKSRVVCLSTNSGQLLPQKIELHPPVWPRSISVDARGRLLVADCGPAQQILIYDNLDRQPELAGAFGARGGIFSGTPGRFGDMRFNHPVCVGSDRFGNIYVASDGQSGGGGTVLESYTSSAKLNWRLFGLEFVDMGDLDPASESDFYTKEEHFRLDYKSPPGRDWQYIGYTVNRFKYPDDPRLNIWSAGAWVRRFQGRLFLFVNDMNGQNLQVYRFAPETDGEIAIPSGLYAGKRLKTKTEWPKGQPEKGEWIWRDANGNGAFDAGEFISNDGRDAPAYQGWWVDDECNIWQAAETAGIRMFQCQGLDAKGNLSWDFSHVTSFPRPTQLARIKRLRYYSKTDVMYLGGTTGEHANQHWKPMGPVICRFDNWSKPERKLRWQIVAPYEKGSRGHSSCEPMGFDVAGDFVFVPYTGASKSMGFSTGHIEVFRASDGGSVGHFEPPPEIGEIGLQDIRECLRAHKRADGSYVIFLEEDWKAKLLMYRWKPQ